MKKLCFFLTVLFILTAGSSIIFAGNVEETTNQSAEWLMTQNRNASTDPDAVFFNPAGTALMADGLYLYIGDQLIIQPITIETDNSLVLSKNQKKEGDKSAYFFPNLYLIFKKWDMAFSLGIMGIGGGGSATFSEGLPAFYGMVAGNLISAGFVPGGPDPYGTIGTITGFDADIRFVGSSAYYSFMINYAYAITENFSISAAYRFMYAYNTFEGSAKNITVIGTGGSHNIGMSRLDAKQTGMAHGVIVGTDYRPLEELNIGMRFEWHSPLKLENDTAKDDFGMYPDGEKVRHTLPMVLAMGVTYTFKDGIAKGLEVGASLDVFLNREVNWEDNKEDLYDTGMQLGAGFAYTIQAFPLTVGAGYGYGTYGANTDTRSEMAEDLDFHNASIGFSYEVIPGLKLTLSYLYTYYVPVDVQNNTDFGMAVETIYYKMSHDLGLGISYKIL